MGEGRATLRDARQGTAKARRSAETYRDGKAWLSEAMVRTAMDRVKEPCEICGRWEYLQTHHIFEGYFLRRQSEKYKQYCTIRICRFCHEKIHKYPLKYIYLKADAQRELMTALNWTMDKWHIEFGKNYLEDEQ